MKKNTKPRHRVPTKGTVVINNAIRAEMLDISEDGMYVYTNTHFIPGAIIQLNFDINNETLSVSAKVRHFQPGVGLGVQFAGLSEDASKKIKGFIKSLRGDK